MNTPLFLQIKYAKLFGVKLDRFAIKNHSPFLASGRCPVCGDSQKNKIKTRFYFYEKAGRIGCQCHNCGFSTNLEGLLRQRDEYLYRQLLTERMSFTQPEKEKKQERRINKNDSWKGCLVPAAFAAPTVRLLEKRLIPSSHWYRFFYSKNLKHSYVDICDAMGIEVDSSKKIPEFEVLFMPFLDKDGTLTFSTSRNLDDTSDLRYVTIEFQPSYKLFGVEKVDESEDIFVTEGPIDSCFLSNAVATGDASLDRAAQVFRKDSLVLVPDNEPRAKVQIRRIEGFIEQGYRVVIWPESIKEKDVNDMVKAGRDVEYIVQTNSYQGLAAKLAFNNWVKL